MFAVAAAVFLLCVTGCRAANQPDVAGGESRIAPEAVLSAGKALKNPASPHRERAAALAALHDIVAVEDNAIAHRMLGEAYQARFGLVMK